MSPGEPILTLEPLLDAVKDGLESAGWELSGLQKTTSYEFEGRWAGDSSRSAYLFFHRDGVSERVSIDVFLDETTRGLKGNIALVVDGPRLRNVADPGKVLDGLSRLAKEALPEGYRTPITLRYRLATPGKDPGSAYSEFRFKLYFPARAMDAGHASVASLATSTAGAFERILDSGGMAALLPPEEP
jgi:hypothetical protein